MNRTTVRRRVIATLATVTGCVALLGSTSLSAEPPETFQQFLERNNLSTVRLGTIGVMPRKWVEVAGTGSTRFLQTNSETVSNATLFLVQRVQIGEADIYRFMTQGGEYMHFRFVNDRPEIWQVEITKPDPRSDPWLTRSWWQVVKYSDGWAISPYVEHSGQRYWIARDGNNGPHKLYFTSQEKVAWHVPSQ